MEKDVYRNLLRKIKKIEEKYGQLSDYVVGLTILDDKHNMIMEEQYSSYLAEADSVYRELAELELADLLDFQKFFGEENGKFC